MTTTALRIELLIIGFQAMIWVLIMFGFNDVIELYVKNTELIKDTAAVIILIVLAACYSLGSMVDSLTAVLEDPSSLFKYREYNGLDSSTMRLKFPDAYKELISSDFELRLLRSTFFNLLTISISALFFIGQNKIFWILLVAGLLVGVGWYRRKKKTESRRTSLYKTAKEIA